MRLLWTASTGPVIDLTATPYIMGMWEGFGGPPVKAQMEKAPYQDGRTLRDERLESRDIIIELTITAADRQGVFNLRRTLARAFNPRNGVGILTWEQDNGQTYTIAALPVQAPEYPGGQAQGESWQRVIIALRAPDPTWLLQGEEEYQVIAFVGGFTLPFYFPFTLGEQVGTYITVLNQGDIETPVRIVAWGELQDPTFTNATTGRSLAFDRTLTSIQRLEVNTAFGQKSARIYETGETPVNAFRYVVPGSEFWGLIPGENLIEYTALAQGPEATVSIIYRHRFVGV